MVTVKLENVDWALLREQKEWLIQAMFPHNLPRKMPAYGLIHLLDEIQDQAAEQLGSKAIFDFE